MLKFSEYGIFNAIDDELEASALFSKREADRFLQESEMFINKSAFYVDIICKKHFGYPESNCPKCRRR